MPGLNPFAHLRSADEKADDVSFRSAVTWPYVSQFILGPAFVEPLAGWQRIAVTGQFKLTAHPDLACTQATDDGRELTLIGHILNPRAPDATNADILRTLLRRFTSREALIGATDRLGGRWLLIAANGNASFLFHDAMGLRQAFYTDPAELRDLWIMSQPGLAGEALSLTPDAQALNYMNTQTFRRTSEFRFPAAASSFKGLKHLLPNHWLDLATGRSHRYWPSSPIEVVGLEAATDRLIALLSGQVRAAAARFDLAVSLTAGIDSRLVLASAKELADRVCIMTVRQGRMPDGHADIEIPARLLKRLGRAHEVVHATSTMTPGFSLRFKRNVYLAHDLYGHDAEAILKRFGRTKAVITGSGAEVGRLPFRATLPHADRVRFTPELLAWLEYGSTHPFLVAHFAEWLADAGQQNYVKLLDLFEWEQDYGNWLAMTQLEFDVAWRDNFTPYNCRELLVMLLGVSERYRRPPRYRLFRRAIRKAWPELLSEPINPHRTPTRLALGVAQMKALIKYWIFRLKQR